MFDGDNQPVAVFCGTDIFNGTTGFDDYVRKLKRVSDGGVDYMEELSGDSLRDGFTPSAEEKVTDCILVDGNNYKGWGYYRNGSFYPHGCERKYYPDFLVELENGDYVILEVKGDHMIDDPVVKAKEAAAEEVAVESSMKYEMLKGSDIMDGKVDI